MLTRQELILFVLEIVCDEDRDNYKGKKNKEKVCEAIYFDSFGRGAAASYAAANRP